MKKFDYLIYIGRFQPFHNGHKEVVEQALDLAENVIILIGSVNQPRTIKDPFSFEERQKMIIDCFSDNPEKISRIKINGLYDKKYNDQLWVEQVQEIVSNTIHLDKYPDTYERVSVGVIGFTKDESSFYLKLFPQWKSVEAENFSGINATIIRNKLFKGENIELPEVPANVGKFLSEFTKTDKFKILSEEFKFIEKYKLAWLVAPYPPTFVTVDAVVIQSGHVLLIKRRAAPGKGLWALPGGFINQSEKIEDAMIRELKEETKLKVPGPVIKGSIKNQKVFDKPDRSLRGRTITHAFLVELPAGELNPVKGADDAEKAKWIPLNLFTKMEPELFEDHFSIVNYFLGEL